MADRPIILTEGLVRDFGEVQALRGIDLQVERGTVLGMLGPNGAGKTTAVRILTTLLAPDERARRGRRPRRRARRRGAALPDRPRRAERRGRREPHRPREPRAGRAPVPPADAPRRGAAAARCSSASTSSDAADRPTKTYSGGMRRRLDLAASLVGRPEVLFLDEPTTGLDPRSRIDVWDVHPRAAGGRHDAAAHDAVPGGGRPARRPDRRDRPRHGDRRGHRPTS